MANRVKILQNLFINPNGIFRMEHPAETNDFIFVGEQKISFYMLIAVPEIKNPAAFVLRDLPAAEGFFYFYFYIILIDDNHFAKHFADKPTQHQDINERKNSNGKKTGKGICT